jgi:hypothetical protein
VTAASQKSEVKEKSVFPDFAVGCQLSIDRQLPQLGLINFLKQLVSGAVVDRASDTPG